MSNTQPEQGDLTDELIATPVWTDESVAAAGIPVVDTPFVTIGGGLGSFAMVDTLRIAGVATAQIRVLTGLDTPSQTYRYLAENSQIPPGERLRSDSASTMDNIWGFPAYAVREAASAKGLAAKLDPLWNVFSEPLVRDFYTPRAGDVYEGVDKEADRIGWHQMVMKGQVRMVRRRYGGGYYSVLTTPPGSSTKRVAIRSSFTHLAVGYPGVRFLPDLQTYRETHSDFSRVVNAYEPHDYVYQELLQRPSTVVVRGSGIVASRILQRLLEDRKRGAQTTVLHLFRNFVHGPQGDHAWMRRPGSQGFAYQGFNFPKAAWGGQLKEQLERLDGEGRKELIAVMGGTNTPRRREWDANLDQGRNEGYYQQYTGQVTEVVPGPDQTIVTRISAPNGGQLELPANFIIDATGLESDIGEHRLLNDLLVHGGAGRNASGRLEVTPTFEVAGARAEPGRLYASGSPTLGGYYAGVDSFLGLQYAALAIADDLATVGFGSRLGMARSVSQWWKWMRNQPVDGPTRAAATAPSPAANQQLPQQQFPQQQPHQHLPPPSSFPTPPPLPNQPPSPPGQVPHQ